MIFCEFQKLVISRGYDFMPPAFMRYEFSEPQHEITSSELSEFTASIYEFHTRIISIHSALALTDPQYSHRFTSTAPTHRTVVAYSRVYTLRLSRQTVRHCSLHRRRTQRGGVLLGGLDGAERWSSRRSAARRGRGAGPVGGWHLEMSPTCHRTQERWRGVSAHPTRAKGTRQRVQAVAGEGSGYASRVRGRSPDPRSVTCRGTRPLVHQSKRESPTCAWGKRGGVSRHTGQVGEWHVRTGSPAAQRSAPIILSEAARRQARPAAGAPWA